MTLRRALNNPDHRRLVAADAITEAEIAVGERSGLTAIAAQLGLDTINRLRPGFLEGHVHALLPAMAAAVEPHWRSGLRA